MKTVTLRSSKEPDPVEASRDPTEHVPRTTGTSYSRLIKTLTQGYLSVSVYLNVVQGHDYYDVVIHRRVKERSSGGQTWKRGANLKPTDLGDLIELLTEVQTYLQAKGVKLTRVV